MRARHDGPGRFRNTAAPATPKSANRVRYRNGYAPSGSPSRAVRPRRSTSGASRKFRAYRSPESVPRPEKRTRAPFLPPIRAPSDEPEEQAQDTCPPRWGGGCPVREERVEPQAPPCPALCKDQVGCDEEKPDPAPFPGDGVASQGDVELPERPAKAPEDREEADEQREPEGDLREKAHGTEEGEVGKDNVLQESLVPIKGRMVNLLPDPPVQPSEPLPILDDPRCLLPGRVYVQDAEPHAEEREGKRGADSTRSFTFQVHRPLLSSLRLSSRPEPLIPFPFMRQMLQSNPHPRQGSGGLSLSNASRNCRYRSPFQRPAKSSVKALPSIAPR